MNTNDFINALGRIDDDLLDRAARYREKGGESHEQGKNARQPLYRRIGLIAACLVILLCAIPISRQALIRNAIRSALEISPVSMAAMNSTG